MSTLIRVEVPDPMAPMWARLRSGDINGMDMVHLLDGLCPSSKHETPSQRWFCTRRRNHTGRHQASDGKTILAVWGN